MHCLARGAGVSQATGYRYLHEGIDVLAEHAPGRHEVLDRCRREGRTHVVLDGTLIESGRVTGVHLHTEGREVDTWHCAKHKAFGANVHSLSTPNGTPLGSPTPSRARYRTVGGSRPPEAAGAGRSQEAEPLRRHRDTQLCSVPEWTPNFSAISGIGLPVSITMRTAPHGTQKCTSVTWTP